MPGMSWSEGSGYRYGFGSHENDDEVYGSKNFMDFGGYGYDNRLGRRWNVDPMYKKYPNISPFIGYNNNPIIYKDPTGNDYAIYIDHTEGARSITIKQTHYVLKNDLEGKASAQLGADYWNSQTGKYEYTTSEGLQYDIRFDVQLKEVENPKEQAMYDKEIVFEGEEDLRLVLDGSSNAYSIKADDDQFFIDHTKDPENTAGATLKQYFVGVKESYKSDETTVSHEFGHTLGLDHTEDLMQLALKFNNGNIDEHHIEEILNKGGIGGNNRSKEMRTPVQVKENGKRPKSFNKGDVNETD
jgi:hypothetical protein